MSIDEYQKILEYKTYNSIRNADIIINQFKGEATRLLTQFGNIIHTKAAAVMSVVKPVT